MAIQLEDKQNVNAPDGTFPYGDVRDNDGSNNGTPLNRAVLSDYFQFFAKLLDAAGITPNDLLENQTNGFQYFDSLIANIRATAASTTESGTVERATQTEMNTGSDTTRYVTPNLIANGTDIIGNQQLENDAVNTNELAADAVTNAKIAPSAVDTLEIANDAVTNAKIAPSAVDTLEIANDAVTSDKIAPNAVDSSEIAASAVDTSEIALGAVNYTKVNSTIVTAPSGAAGIANTNTISDDNSMHYVNGATLNIPAGLTSGIIITYNANLIRMQMIFEDDRLSSRISTDFGANWTAWKSVALV